MSRKRICALAAMTLLTGVCGTVPILLGGGSAYASTRAAKIFTNNSTDVEGSVKIKFTCTIHPRDLGSNSWSLSMTRVNVTDATGVSWLTKEADPTSAAIVIDLPNGAFQATVGISQNSMTGLWQVAASGFLPANASECNAGAPVDIYNAGANNQLLNFSGALP